jgi:hypothetical protein
MRCSAIRVANTIAAWCVATTTETVPTRWGRNRRLAVMIQRVKVPSRCRCTDSEVGERLVLQREFDACVAKHSGDILARRHEGDRLVIAASMYTDFSICAHDVACTFARSATDPKARHHRWRLRSDAWFGWAGGVPRVCAILDAGGIRATVDDAREQATVETEVGTHVDRCMGYSGNSFELAN